MATIQRFEELDVWQASREMTRHIYEVSTQGRFARDFGLRDQIQRASVSVMSNIAEGFESRTQRIFIDLLGRARGSAGEVRSQLYVALDLEYVSQPKFDDLFRNAEKCSRQIYRLIDYLESRPNSSRVREDPVAYEINLPGDD